jgi:hypothetical protein
MKLIRVDNELIKPLSTLINHAQNLAVRRIINYRSSPPSYCSLRQRLLFLEQPRNIPRRINVYMFGRRHFR